MSLAVRGRRRYRLLVGPLLGLGTLLLCFSFLAPLRGQSPAIARVQHAGIDAGAATSSTLAFPSSNQAGNLIVVAVRAGRAGQTLTVTDSRANTYRLASQLNVTVDAPTGDTLAIFYAENIQAGPNVVSVSGLQTGTTLRFAILEYSGVSPVNALRTAASAQGTDALPASGGLTVDPGEIVIGAIMTADGRTFTAGNGFAVTDLVPAAPGTTKLMVEDRTAQSAGPIVAGGTLSSSNPWGAMGAVFRPGTSSPAPDLSIAKTHSGSFIRGQTHAYTITVANVGTASAAGTVNVIDTLPGGLTATAISGGGWTCSLAALSCSRNDALAAGASYPPIGLTVQVDAAAPASVTNTATVSGGGDSRSGNNAASDPTSIVNSTATDTQPPSAPTGLTSTSPSSTRIDLSWSAASDNVAVTSYIVERCQGVGCASFTEIARVEDGQQPFAGMGPLTASANPNYFKDPSGRPLILAGSHTWNNIQDWGTGGALQPFDFNAYVDFLVSHGHNFTLLWYIEQPRFCDFPSTSGTPPEFSVGPHPWLRTGPGTATDGLPKFDLTKYDPAFFTRLRTRAQALHDAGIYAGVYTFTAEWLARYRCSQDGYPFDGANNINGIADGGGTRSVTMTSPNAITAIQDAYVEKVIDTLNDLPNVLWIVSQEAPVGSEWWNAHQIAHIRSYEAGKTFQHPIGYGTMADLQDAEIINSDADWIAPAARESPTTSCGSGNPRCKVNINDSDHSFFGLWNSDVQQHRYFVWSNFMTGNQAVFMDPYVVYYPREDRNSCASPTNGICAQPHPRYDNFRDNFGYILQYSRRLNLSSVLPRPSLCSTSYCLAQTPAIGAEYLVYAPNGGSFTVNLSAMSSARTLNVEWLNLSTGAAVAGSPIPAGASSRSFTAPFSGDAVLYLVDSAGHAGSTTLATSYSVTDAVPGTYRFRVRAGDAAGNLGPYSNETTITVASPDSQPPTAPSGLTATPATGQIQLAWTAATDDGTIDKYVVERCQGANCSSFAQVASPSGTAYSDAGLAPSTTYSYRVRAIDAAGNAGPWSAVATATTPPSSSAVSLVQRSGIDAGSATSASLAFAASNTAGNLIVVAVRTWPNTQQPTVTDVRGNVYRQAARVNETQDGMTLAIYYAENIAGGSNALTVANSQSGGTLRFAIAEYSGLARSGALVGAGSGQGRSAAASTAPVTPTAAPALGFGAVSTADPRAFVPADGFRTIQQVPATSVKLLIEDWIAPPAAGSVSAGASLDASDMWAAAVAFFRAER